MSRLPFMLLDAFTQTRYGGNPCAVVFDADRLDVEQMLMITREMNLSETVFVMQSDVALFRLRFFTHTGELPMAGHPTIAAIAGLQLLSQMLSPDVGSVQVELESGITRVEVNWDGDYPLFTMVQHAPQFMHSYDKEDVAPAFGLDPADLMNGHPCQTVSTGTPILLVPVASMANLNKARMDLNHYQWLHARGDFCSAHLFVCEGYDEAGSTFARHFVLPPDVTEDPFTGSATGAMAAYLWQQGLTKQHHFVAQQGHNLGRPGSARVSLLFHGDMITGIRVGGYAVEVVSGNISVPDKLSVGQM